MKNFSGIFTALLTPFAADGGINERALAWLIERNIRAGVTGFYACGSTAEVFTLSPDERRTLMRLCAEINAGRTTMIAHVGAISTDESAALAKEAAKLGYDAVSAVAPFYYKFTFDEILAHYRTIADATALPVLVYNFPAFSGVMLDAEHLSVFMEDERFFGIKHTSNDFFTLGTIKAHYPDKVVYNGYDEMFLSGLAAGADGGIGSTYNFMAEKYVKIRAHYLAGEMDAARVLQNECGEIISVLKKTGVMAGEKAILNLLGGEFGGCRRPFADCDADGYALLEREVLHHLQA
jgi:N-acetylneuraminate lyase